MSSTNIYKLTRIGVIAAFVAGTAVACHSNDYKTADETPGADSGTVRTNTAAALSDSTQTSATNPSAAPMPATTTPATSKPVAGTSPVTKAKFARGHAVISAPKIYGTTEVAPEFPGGQRALDNYVNNHVNYPQQAIDDNVSGVVHVSFVVDENGNVTKAKVMDGDKVGGGLDQEALRVVRDMPTWTPGKVKGHTVKTRLELPISFQVES